MKTKAAVLFQQNTPLEILELTIPPLKKGQVLVQLAYSGLCQTQLNEIRGVKGPDPYLPHTMGHEGSGTVLEIGEGVQKVKPGDRVVLSWIKGSGADVPQTIYTCGNKEIQSGAISTFLETAVISENRLIPIVPNMPLREAALLGCAIPTGAGVIFNQMKLPAGESLAIFGLGGVGLSALIAAKTLDPKLLIAVDISDEKLEKAANLGATHTFNPKRQNILDELKSLTNNLGVNFALESAGKKEVMELAYSSINPQKGICILAGNIPKGQKIEIDPFDLIRGKQIYGTWGGSSSIDSDTNKYANLFLSNKFPLQSLISHEVPLEKINFLLTELENGRVNRGLLHLRS